MFPWKWWIKLFLCIYSLHHKLKYTIYIHPFWGSIIWQQKIRGTPQFGRLIIGLFHTSTHRKYPDKGSTAAGVVMCRAILSLEACTIRMRTLAPGADVAGSAFGDPLIGYYLVAAAAGTRPQLSIQVLSFLPFFLALNGAGKYMVARKGTDRQHML